MLHSDEVLHLDVVILTHELEKPKRPTHEVEAIVEEGHFLTVAHLHLVATPDRIISHIIVVEVIHQQHLVVGVVFVALTYLEVIVHHTGDLPNHRRVVQEDDVSTVLCQAREDGVLASIGGYLVVYILIKFNIISYLCCIYI